MFEAETKELKSIFECSNCHRDIREVGVHEFAEVYYTSSTESNEIRFDANTIFAPEDEYLRCGFCDSIIPIGIEQELNISRNPARNREQIRYGNVTLDKTYY